MVKKPLNITGTVTLPASQRSWSAILREPFCRGPAWQDLWLLARDGGQIGLAVSTLVAMVWGRGQSLLG